MPQKMIKYKKGEIHIAIKQFKRDKSQNSNKLHLDKYYTPKDLAKYCINKTYEVIGRENISEIIEPSAGDGAFSNQIPGCLAYDIEPENENIKKQDYLELDISYKEGRLIIGNPPYGARNTLAVQFYKKSIDIADYIAFILPISQLNNNQQMYEFDLIHSEDLGLHTYTDREVHCCFNIYKRPANKILNKKPKYKLTDVEIIEVRLGNKAVEKYDFRICAWGSIGKEVEYDNQYAKEFCIVIHNNQLKSKIIQLIKNADWKSIYPMTSMPSLLQWQVYEYLLKNIPELK